MKVAIAGFGLEGTSNLRYWSALTDDITVFDENPDAAGIIPKDVPSRIGEGVFGQMEGFDLVVRTAGLDPSKIKTDGKIWSATQEFFARVETPIIGVTGTKGKGTTASFVTEILSAAGRRVHLLGNVGVPSLDVIAKIHHDDIVIYELSSFQLWDMERSPHVAVVMMIEPDHLDVHHSMDDYVMAKANIARWQKKTDVCIFNNKNEFSSRIASMSVGRKLPYSESPGCTIEDDYFVMDGVKICKTDSVVLPGRHNLENACAAITAAWQFTHDIESIEKGLSNFKGLPHRLKFVREFRDVRFYDDSIATTPGSAIAAINSFEEPKVIILGGSDKGADFSGLIRAVKNSSSIRGIITIGQTGDKLSKLLGSDSKLEIKNLGLNVSMKEIVELAFSLAEKGDVVIMSPACASFDMFKSYTDRGEQFVSSVESL